MTRTKPPKKPKKGPGRTGHYKNEMLEQVYKLALLGARNVDIANFFKVHVTTIEYWIRNRPGFAKALQAGKMEADTKVAEAMFNRALGYQYDEIHTEEFFTTEGVKVTKTRVITKTIPPDVTAQIFWLKNRQRDLWADVHKIDVTQRKELDLSGFNENEKQLLKSISIKRLSDGVSKN